MDGRAVVVRTLPLPIPAPTREVVEAEMLGRGRVDEELSRRLCRLLIAARHPPRLHSRGGVEDAKERN